MWDDRSWATMDIQSSFWAYGFSVLSLFCSQQYIHGHPHRTSQILELVLTRMMLAYKRHNKPRNFLQFCPSSAASTCNTSTTPV